MEKVLGIGGLFVGARDPDALGEWYERHLGVTRPPETYEQGSWRQQAGSTVFACFGEPGPSGRAWGLNFRVRDLDAMVAQLRGAEIGVEVDPEPYPNGRFAHALDPEGNPVDLWEPAGADA